MATLGALMARLFLAVWPPDDVVADLLALPRKDQRGVRFVHPDNWHITLRFIGDAHADDVETALAGFRPSPARVRLGPAVDVLNERALVLPVDGLDAVAADVNERTRTLGEPPRQRFVGHLTLARVKLHVAMPKALGMMAEAEFEMEEVALVQSRLDPAGARYSTIATWPVVR